MARYKAYSYEQKIMIPVSLENQILPGTFEHTLNVVTDQMDLASFDERYSNDATGASAYDPAILLKIILYAYSKGIISSRKIAQLCEENIVCMALAAEARSLYSKRMGTVEPVFGHLAGTKRLNRFTLKGKDKVNTQWLLYCVVHNLGKIQKYGA